MSLLRKNRTLLILNPLILSALKLDTRIIVTPARKIHVYEYENAQITVHVQQYSFEVAIICTMY